MSDARSDRRRGSQPGEQDSSADQSLAAITKADQMTWEAPELRPVFTPDGQREAWAFPCPNWCTGEGEGHEGYWATAHSRQHEGVSLRVRQDAARAYYADEGEDGEAGITAAHLEVRLVAGSRSAHGPQVKIDAHWGKESAHRKFGLAPMYPDEVHELIAVLQHLLKVGQES